MTRPTNTKRIAIKNAVIKLSLEKGLHGWTHPDLAAAAGVPQGNLYYYFKVTNDLKHEVCQYVNSNEGTTALKEQGQNGTDLLQLKVQRLLTECFIFQLENEAPIRKVG